MAVTAALSPSSFPQSSTGRFEVIAVLGICNLALQKGDEFGGVTPVPLRANPELLLVCLLGIPTAGAIAWLMYARLPRALRGVSWTGVTISVMFAGVLLAIMEPGPGSIVARDLFYAPPSAQGSRIFALPIYFANGKDDLSPSELQRIKDAIEVFRDCEAGTLMVRGFASSATYPKDNEYHNKKLANDRALSVKSALDEGKGKESARAVKWKTYDEMVKARKLPDVDVAGKRLADIEKLNRRVEVFWNDSLCAPAN